MKKKVYIAVLIETTENSSLFPVILHGDSPEDVFEQLKHALKVEADERGVDFSVNESLLDEIAAGNETSGPEPIPAKNTGSNFQLATKVIEIDTKSKTEYGVFNAHGELLKQFGTFTTSGDAYNVLRKAQEKHPYAGCHVKEINK